MHYDTGGPDEPGDLGDSRGYRGPHGSRPQSPPFSREIGGSGYPHPYPRQAAPQDGRYNAPLSFRPVAANLPATRYGDGEVTRYGAGESYRPFNRDRSPRRSPPPPPPPTTTRRRSRSPVRDARRSPPPASDSYVPSRTPRRRSRSTERIIGGDRYRTAPTGGERWRGRDRSRSRDRRSPPARRFSPRRSPRRSPGRYSPPRRDDRDRARSPPRMRDSRFGERRLPSRISDLTLNRRRSRSPHDRDTRDPRDSRDSRDAGLNSYRPRSPRRAPSPPRGSNTYRPRSRTPERRDDRYNPGPSNYRRSPPPRESNISSAITSRSASRRNSPRPPSVRVKEESPAPPSQTTIMPVREAPKPTTASEKTPPVARSPPRGPAALRGAVPTGPSATRNVSVPVASPMQQSRPFAPTAPTARPDMSPSIPPAGPRGYVPRGGFGAPRGNGRGVGWNAGPPRSMAPPTPAPTGPSAANNGIPTGPRATSMTCGPTSGSPSIQSRPFNPPTGPAAQQAAPSRPTLVQSLMNTQPQLVPGGRVDPSLTPLVTGVTKDLEPHYMKLRMEEEKIRDELNIKREKLRRSLHAWDKIEREAKVAGLRSELTEESLAKISGELGGSAF